MTTQAERPRRIRRESIAPPYLPDEATLDRLRDHFRTMPRITEAWISGSRLTPENGSAPYETTDIVLVLDPPVTPVDDVRSQIEALHEVLEPTAFAREPDRGWIFTPVAPREGLARMIYTSGC